MYKIRSDSAGKRRNKHFWTCKRVISTSSISVFHFQKLYLNTPSVRFRRIY